MGRKKRLNKRSPATTTTTSNIPETSKTKEPRPVQPKLQEPVQPKEIKPTFTIEQWFNKYKEGEEVDDEGNLFIGPEGVSKICEDMGVQPEDPLMLYFAWQLKAERMGYFSKGEFIAGLKHLKFVEENPDYSWNKMKTRLGSMMKETKKDAEQFQSLYNYAFTLCKDNKDSKVIDKEMAMEMLKVVMNVGRDSGEGCIPHLDQFLEFLGCTKDYNALNRDHWVCFLTFGKEVKEDMENYDENSSWPVLYDDYAAFVKEKSGAVIKTC